MYARNTQNIGLEGRPAHLPRQKEVQKILNAYFENLQLKPKQVARLTAPLDVKSTFNGPILPYDTVLLPKARDTAWKAHTQAIKRLESGKVYSFKKWQHDTPEAPNQAQAKKRCQKKPKTKKNIFCKP